MYRRSHRTWGARREYPLTLNHRTKATRGSPGINLKRRIGRPPSDSILTKIIQNRLNLRRRQTLRLTWKRMRIWASIRFANLNADSKIFFEEKPLVRMFRIPSSGTDILLRVSFLLPLTPASISFPATVPISPRHRLSTNTPHPSCRQTKPILTHNNRMLELHSISHKPPFSTVSSSNIMKVSKMFFRGPPTQLRNPPRRRILPVFSPHPIKLLPASSDPTPPPPHPRQLISPITILAAYKRIINRRKPSCDPFCSKMLLLPPPLVSATAEIHWRRYKPLGRRHRREFRRRRPA